MAAAAVTMPHSETNYYQLLYEEYDDDDDEGNGGCEEEMACVGAGLGGGFQHTSELHAMKYKQAMENVSDRKHWEKAVGEEHERMVKMKVWKPVESKLVPSNAKVIASTWAMKKKANGTFRARLNARGFEQIDGVHYDSTNIFSPVTNASTIRIIMVLSISNGWTNELIDVKGAFL